MYDRRERAIRDRKWELADARREGKLERKLEGRLEGKIDGTIKMIHILEELLKMPLSDETELRPMSVEQLEVLAKSLEETLRSRIT